MGTSRITAETRDGVTYDKRRDMVGREYSSGKITPKIYLLPVENYEPTEWELASTGDIILLRKKKGVREFDKVCYDQNTGTVYIYDKQK